MEIVGRPEAGYKLDEFYLCRLTLKYVSNNKQDWELQSNSSLHFVISYIVIVKILANNS